MLFCVSRSGEGRGLEQDHARKTVSNQLRDVFASTGDKKASALKGFLASAPRKAT